MGISAGEADGEGEVKQRGFRFGLIVFLIVASLLICLVNGLNLTSFSRMHGLLSPSIHLPIAAVPAGSADDQDAMFDDRQRFILRAFDRTKPMSSFLAGLGGLWGAPLWAFFVNRGQAVSSFGVQNKDGGIMRFVTAEKAYQQTALVCLYVCLCI